MRTRTAAERLADHVHELRFADLPAEVVAKAKELFVHHLGVALRGHDSPSGRQASAVATFLGDGAGSCTVIGHREPAAVLDAVFVNSLLMGHAAMDDFQLPAGVHQGVVTWPVAMAFGERTCSSGQEVITAVVAGYDAVAKLARVLFPWELPVPRQPYSIYASFGAAAVGSRLLGLSLAQTAHAMAHAAHLGVGLVEAGSAMEPLEPMVARNGAMAAVLAQAGFPMTPTSIEGEHGLYRTTSGRIPDGLDESLATLGTVFEIMAATPKRYSAGSGLNIVPQELTLDLLRREGLTAEDIASVQLTLPEEREQRERLMSQRLEENVESPLWSARFLVAAVVACSAIDPGRYVEQRDDSFNTVIDRVRLRFEPDRPMEYARVDLTTTDGVHHVADGDGHVVAPLDWASWLAEGGRRVLSQGQLDQLVELIADIDGLDDVTKLTHCLVPT